MRKFAPALGLVFLLNPILAYAVPVVGPVSVAPASIRVNTPTAVTVTAQIVDPSLIPASVNLIRVNAAGTSLEILGTLNDAGLNGDVIAGDRIFTTRITVTATAAVYVRVSAAFSGMLRRVMSEIRAIPLADLCAGVTCTALDQCHAAGVCDPATGLCSNPAAVNGTACNDGNACTAPDSCQVGQCRGVPVTCADNNSCTLDSCNPSVGCVHTDQRTAVNMSPALHRYIWPHSNGLVDLYYDRNCSHWGGIESAPGLWVQDDEPQSNYCGPTAGKNLLGWYTGTSPDYDTLGGEMQTNDWMQGWDLISDCLCFCSPVPYCALPELTCAAICTVSGGVADMLDSVGTSPDNLEDVLRNRAPAGYRLVRQQENPGLDVFEGILQGGNPITVLIWTGSRLHWTLVTGTYDDNGTTRVRFANHTDQTWDWFEHQWSFEGLDAPAPAYLSSKGLDRYTWMRYVEVGRLDAGHAVAEGFANIIVSQDGSFGLAMLGGEIGLYQKVPVINIWLGVPLWRSNTYGSAARTAVMQGDGNFVLYDASHQPVWSTHTEGHPGAYLVVQNDGNVVIYSASNQPLWESGTGGH